MTAIHIIVGTLGTDITEEAGHSITFLGKPCVPIAGSVGQWSRVDKDQLEIKVGSHVGVGTVNAGKNQPKQVAMILYVTKVFEPLEHWRTSYCEVLVLAEIRYIHPELERAKFFAIEETVLVEFILRRTPYNIEVHKYSTSVD